MNNVDILVPDLPESVADATVVKWNKKLGDIIKQDEVVVEIETDKVILEIPSTINGILSVILKDVGSIVNSREVLGILKIINLESKKNDFKENNNTNEINPNLVNDKKQISKNKCYNFNNNLSPSVRRLLAKYDLNSSEIKNISNNEVINRKDINEFILKNLKFNNSNNINISESKITIKENRNDKRILMTRLRKRIAERMLEAKNNTAMLTTFNEVNMNCIIKLRKNYGEDFEKKHGIRLGFMSFYVKATIAALKEFPEINACIDGDSIIYHDYFDISIAISTPRGLVTPVIKNANLLKMPEIEKIIKDLAIKGRNSKLTLDELIGGNFTITNGGVFGSLMSTPIINPPQSAILGIHAIKDRPIAINGQVSVMPMMYIALSYDHRLIDGRESVGFLLRIKDLLENPIRLMLDV